MKEQLEDFKETYIGQVHPMIPFMWPVSFFPLAVILESGRRSHLNRLAGGSGTD